MIGGITITTLSGAVSYFLSLGLTVPTDLEFLRILAIGGAVAAYPFSTLTTKRFKGWGLVVCTTATLVVLFVSLLSYVFLIDRGAISQSMIVLLAFLMTLIFFSLFYLISIGVGLAAKSGEKAPATSQRKAAKSKTRLPDSIANNNES